MNIKLIVALAASISLSACATITKGTNFDVQVASEPSAAEAKFVNTENKYEGGTCVKPCSMKLNRKGTYKATVSKEGFDPYEILVFPKVAESGVAGGIGNVIAGGLVGLAVDASTGAMKDLYPGEINVVLKPEGELSYRTDKDGNKVDDLFEDEEVDIKS